MSIENENGNLAKPMLAEVIKRTYAPNCPNCGTTAKLDTEKYCCEECKIEYKARISRKFSGNYFH